MSNRVIQRCGRFLHVCWNLEVGIRHPLTRSTRVHASVNALLMKPFITLSQLNQLFLATPPPGCYVDALVLFLVFCCIKASWCGYVPQKKLFFFKCISDCYWRDVMSRLTTRHGVRPVKGECWSVANVLFNRLPSNLNNDGK